MIKCHFCERTFVNVGARGKHEKTCKYNPNKVDKCGGQSKGCTTWCKGLSKETDVRIALMSNTLSAGYKSGRLIPHYTSHTDEWKQAQSDRKKALYLSGWEPVCGRAKKYEYNSINSGIIKVDGTWEYTAALFLDNISVKWVRNKKRFNYIRPDGTKSTYQPDFYIEDWNTYLEVKGYETDLDRCKWNQFEEPLIVWRKEEIEIINILNEKWKVN